MAEQLFLGLNIPITNLRLINPSEIYNSGQLRSGITQSVPTLDKQRICVLDLPDPIPKTLTIPVATNNFFFDILKSATQAMIGAKRRKPETTIDPSNGSMLAPVK